MEPTRVVCFSEETFADWQHYIPFNHKYMLTCKVQMRDAAIHARLNGDNADPLIICYDIVKQAP